MLDKKEKHIPVLLKEVVDTLDLKNGMTVVDGTLGGGGHAREIIQKIMPDGFFIGIDLDEKFLKITLKDILKKFPKYKDRMKIFHGNYANIKEFIKELKIEKVDRILVDLGFSSWHISDSGKGFSFNSEEILDMRYDASLGVPAYQVLNSYSAREIEDILMRYGEEMSAHKIAKAILESRKQEKIITADQLREVVGNAKGGRKGKIDPSTKTFQALRIYVNQELDNLQDLLDVSTKILNKNGRIAIISFHSMEDRIVKHYFKNLEFKGGGKVLTKKPIMADEKEIKENPRSRSAKLRVFEFNGKK